MFPLFIQGYGFPPTFKIKIHSQIESRQTPHCSFAGYANRPTWQFHDEIPWSPVYRPPPSQPAQTFRDQSVSSKSSRRDSLSTNASGPGSGSNRIKLYLCVIYLLQKDLTSPFFQPFGWYQGSHFLQLIKTGIEGMGHEANGNIGFPHRYP